MCLCSGGGSKIKLEGAGGTPQETLKIDALRLHLRVNALTAFVNTFRS